MHQARRWGTWIVLWAAVAVSPAMAAEKAPASRAKPVNVEQNPAFNAVVWMQNSAEYRLGARQAYRTAGDRLETLLNDPLWTADLKQLDAGGYVGKPPAVILDLDETVLDNSAYNARLILDGQPFDMATWLQWVRQEQAPAVPGAVEFLLTALRRGVHVVYITNRSDEEKTPTINNLRKLGLPADEETVLTANPDDDRGTDKVSRRALVARHYRIVMLVGDNLGDFCDGVNTADQPERNAAAEAKERLLGAGWILLPNATYGGWEKPIKALSDKRQALHPQR
jgi:acid phosphatase